jgi:cysteine desulfuration protein SufE
LKTEAVTDGSWARMRSLQSIIDDFDLLDEWDERYRYLIELGRELEPLPEALHNETNRVKGCASQVWLATTTDHRDGTSVLSFKGDSDAHIVKGLITLTLALYSGQPAAKILATDAGETFKRLGLSEHLTPQRSNGVRAMVERIKSDARSALAAVTV